MSQHRHTISPLDIIWYYKFQLAFYIVVVSGLTFVGLYVLNAVPSELKLNDSPVSETAAKNTSKSTSKTASKNTQNSSKTAVISPNAANLIRPTPLIYAADEVAQTIRGNAGGAGSTVNAGSTIAPGIQSGPMPTRVVISKINVDIPISNPTSENANTLNEYLLRGAVRYPTSGTIGKGNLFVFGHSTGLSVVNNKAFKAFNGLSRLQLGDEIHVYSGDKKYAYKVTSVAVVKSNDELVDLSSTQSTLTLATCNIWGQKEDRFVVKATFVGLK
jgi:LPXTG-site transpeptidase (sortase) family protein